MNFFKIFENKRFSTQPSSGGGRGAFTISRRAGRLLLFRSLPGLTGAWMGGAACLPMPSSMALLGWRLLRMQCRSGGGRRGPPSLMSRLGRCGRQTDGGSSCPPGQDMLDRLSLLLCSRELLGHVLDCVAKEAGLGHRNLEEPNFVGIPHVNHTRPEVTLLDHKCGHGTTQRNRGDLRRSEREVSCGSELFQNFQIVTTLVQVPQCYSLKNLQ